MVSITASTMLFIRLRRGDKMIDTDTLAAVREADHD